MPLNINPDRVPELVEMHEALASVGVDIEFGCHHDADQCAEDYAAGYGDCCASCAH